MFRTYGTFTGNIPIARSFIAGAYVLTQINTGQCYIGSTLDGYKRILQHNHYLRKNTHHNLKLQKAFNESPYFDVSFLKVHPKIKKEHVLSAIRQMEQSLLDELVNSPCLLNAAIDTLAAGKGRAVSLKTRIKISNSNKGRLVTQEARRLSSETRKARILAGDLSKARPVMIGDIFYATVNDVAKAFNISHPAVAKRIRSKHPSFESWRYAGEFISI